MCQEDKNTTQTTTTETANAGKEIPKDDGHQMSQSEIDALIAMLLG